VLPLSTDKTPLLVVEKLVKEYPRQGAIKSLASMFRRGPAPETGNVPRVDASASRLAAAKASGWSENPAAGKSTTSTWSCG